MAGDWLKVEKETPEKPEILAIAAALKIAPEEAFGRCFKVWRWADSHTVDGNARVTLLYALDLIAGLTGFAQALLDVGWLKAESGMFVVPNFERHMGQSGKRRALTSQRVAQKRLRDCQAESAKCNAGSNASSVTPSSLLFSYSSEGIGGVGEREAGTRDPQDFGLTAEGLAQAWCFHCTRRNRSGVPADTVQQVVGDFAELLRLGVPPEMIRQDILDRERDHSEQIFHLRDRLKRNAGIGDRKPKPRRLTKAERDAQVLADRRALNERLGVVEDLAGALKPPE